MQKASNVALVSIEHQIDIHILDLQVNTWEVLNGLKFMMDYRLKNGMKHLDMDLMRRLLQGLLQIMTQKQGNLLLQKPTREADLALVLLGDFVEQIREFRQCLLEVSVADLRYSLKIHRRYSRH